MCTDTCPVPSLIFNLIYLQLIGGRYYKQAVSFLKCMFHWKCVYSFIWEEGMFSVIIVQNTYLIG